jgi:hypothetical protein
LTSLAAQGNDPGPNPSLGPPFVPEKIYDIANGVLGFAYNPISGNLGSSCVLILDPGDVQIIRGSSSQFDEIIHLNELKMYGKVSPAQLLVDFRIRDVAGWSSHYSASTAFESAVSSESHLYIAKKFIAVAKVVPLRPRLSAAILSQINRLPRWNLQVQLIYDDFFESHGTHVVLCAALGGVLRLVFRNHANIDERTVRHVLEGEPHVPSSGSTIFGDSIPPPMIFVDGGKAEAPQLSEILRELFHQIQNPRLQFRASGWPQARTHWMESLETDSVFCPDDHRTQYWWLHNCGGLTADQQNDLRLASKIYLTPSKDRSMVHKTPHPLPPSTAPPSLPLPRERNLENVERTLNQIYGR